MPKMSSVLSQTEERPLTTAVATPIKVENQKVKFVRSSSIEKIKRFNTFICSQQYYILPSILSWLKSSHSGLQLSTERTIFFFRSLFFKSILYKYFVVGIKSSGLWSSDELLTTLMNVKIITIANFYDKFTNCFESTFLLEIAVYGACIVVLVQLLTTIYLLFLTLVPYGFVFLVVCMLSINYICYKTIFFYLSNRLIHAKLK